MSTKYNANGGPTKRLVRFQKYKNCNEMVNVSNDLKKKCLLSSIQSRSLESQCYIKHTLDLREQKQKQQYQKIDSKKSQ